MAQILITAGIFFLIIVSLFLILVVLMQRANSDGGMGTAFGGGITESAFGTEAGNVMTKITKYTFVIFFVTGFILYLAILNQHTHKAKAAETLFDEEAAAEAKRATATQTTKVPAPATVPAQQVPAKPATPAPAAPAPVAPAKNGVK
jgi:preprotein translocase subunit SecG